MDPANSTPASDPNATPAAPAPPQTFQDLLDKRSSDQSALASAKSTAAATAAAAAAAAQAVNDAQGAISADEAAIGTAVTSAGPFYEVNPDGTASFFLSDGNGSYHETVAKPASTALSAPSPA